MRVWFEITCLIFGIVFSIIGYESGLVAEEKALTQLSQDNKYPFRRIADSRKYFMDEGRFASIKESSQTVLAPPSSVANPVPRKGNGSAYENLSQGAKERIDQLVAVIVENYPSIGKYELRELLAQVVLKEIHPMIAMGKLIQWGVNVALADGHINHALSLAPTIYTDTKVTRLVPDQYGYERLVGEYIGRKYKGNDQELGEKLLEHLSDIAKVLASYPDCTSSSAGYLPDFTQIDPSISRKLTPPISGKLTP